MTNTKFLAALAVPLILCACAATSSQMPVVTDDKPAGMETGSLSAPVFDDEVMQDAPVIAAKPMSAPQVAVEPEMEPAIEPAPETLLFTAQTQWETQSLVAALREANLEAALEADGSYTVFAPNNDAFERVADGAASADVLKGHVVSGAYSTDDIRAAVASEGSLKLETLAGTTLLFYVFGDSVKVSGANGVLTTLDGRETAASNGVLHEISSVLASE